MMSVSDDFSHLASTAARRLEPGEFTLRLHAKDKSLLECVLAEDGTVFTGVSAVLLFPVSHPRQYVSLRYVDEADKEHEIGIVVHLNELPGEQQALIQDRLVRHYHEQVIEKIVSVKQRYGQLFFSVITQRGQEEFVMPWRQDRAEDWGNNGKVLLDSLNNRYLVPDVERLSNREKRMFKTHVYW
jgi:hypothetical protein